MQRVIHSRNPWNSHFQVSRLYTILSKLHSILATHFWQVTVNCSFISSLSLLTYQPYWIVATRDKSYRHLSFC